MSTGRTLARNTAFNGAGRLWDGVISLLLTAYIVRTLGTAQYGLWGVATAVTGYAGILDLGAGSAFAKYIAEHSERREDDQVSAIVSTGLAIYLALGVVFVAIAWLALDGLLALAANVRADVAGDFANPVVRDDLKYLVRGGILLFAAANCVSAFTAVQTGLQRMGVTNALSFGASWVKVISTVVFLENGFGVRGLVLVHACVLGMFAVGSITAAFVLWPRLRVSPARISRAAAGRLLSFGWRAQVARLAHLIMFETDVLVIALVLRNVELAGIYKIGLDLANKMRQLPSILLSAVLPAASAINARGDRERLLRLYLTASRYVAAAVVPVALFLAGGAYLTLRAWIGPQIDLRDSAIVLQIMAIGYIANMLPGAGVAVALGAGRPDLQMKSGLVSMSSNLVLTIVLALAVGFWGVPAATACSMLISWVWFSTRIGNLLEVPLREYVRRVIVWPVLSALPGAVVCTAASEWYFSDVGRWESFAAICGAVAIGLAAYALILRRAPVFDQSDIAFFRRELRLDLLPGFAWWARGVRAA